MGSGRGTSGRGHDKRERQGAWVRAAECKGNRAQIPGGDELRGERRTLRGGSVDLMMPRSI